jgi:hypothetical protein
VTIPFILISLLYEPLKDLKLCFIQDPNEKSHNGQNPTTLVVKLLPAEGYPEIADKLVKLAYEAETNPMNVDLDGAAVLMKQLEDIGKKTQNKELAHLIEHILATSRQIRAALGLE